MHKHLLGRGLKLKGCATDMFGGRAWSTSHRQWNLVSRKGRPNLNPIVRVHEELSAGLLWRWRLPAADHGSRRRTTARWWKDWFAVFESSRLTQCGRGKRSRSWGRMQEFCDLQWEVPCNTQGGEVRMVMLK